MIALSDRIAHAQPLFLYVRGGHFVMNAGWNRSNNFLSQSCQGLISQRIGGESCDWEECAFS